MKKWCIRLKQSHRLTKPLVLIWLAALLGMMCINFSPTNPSNLISFDWSDFAEEQQEESDGLEEKDLPWHSMLSAHSLGFHDLGVVCSKRVDSDYNFWDFGYDEIEAPPPRQQF